MALLLSEHSPAHEHLTAALLCVVEGNPKAVQECLRPELKLQSYLEITKQLLAEKEENMVGSWVFSACTSFAVKLSSYPLVSVEGFTLNNLEELFSNCEPFFFPNRKNWTTSNSLTRF